MTGHPPPGRAELAAGLLAGGAALLLAAPVGLLWLVLAPRPLVAPQGQGLRIVDVESPAFFGSDAVLLLLGLAAGVLLGWPAGSAVTLGLLLGTRTPAVTSQRALSSG